MINSAKQADDDANVGGDIAVDSAHTSISLTVPPASLILQSGCQPYARTDHNQRPAVKPRYCSQRSIAPATGYHHDQS